MLQPEIPLFPGSWHTLDNVQGQSGGFVVPANNLFLVGSKWQLFIQAENSSYHLSHGVQTKRMNEWMNAELTDKWCLFHGET